MTRTRQIERWENSMNTTKRLDGKLGFVLCTVAVAAWTGCTTYQEQPRGGGAYEGSYAEIRTESDFYEPLSPYGRWEVVGSYGRCWIPGGVDAGWSPYSNGYWQESDAGWYWASDEPWGWATYHYGRWDSSPQYGWYWVPQTQWARVGLLAGRRWICRLGANGPVGQGRRGDQPERRRVGRVRIRRGTPLSGSRPPGRVHREQICFRPDRDQPRSGRRGDRKVQWTKGAGNPGSRPARKRGSESCR